MAKKFKKSFSIVLIMCFICSALPMQALAAESPEIESKLDTSGTVVTDISGSSNTTYDENGNPIIVVEFKEINSHGTSADGADVTGKEVTTTTTTTLSNGSVQIETALDGNEKKEWTDLEVEPGQEVPDVRLEFTGSGEVSVKVDNADDPDVDVTVDGSVTTTTTATTEREVNGSLSITEQSFSIDGENSHVSSPVAPEDYEGKNHHDYGADSDTCRLCVGGCDPKVTGHYRTGLFDDTLPDYGDYFDKPENEAESDRYDAGYDLTWTGYGDATNEVSAIFATWDTELYEHPYLLDENGEIVYEYGQPVYDMTKVRFVSSPNQKAENDPTIGNQATGMVSTPSQFALKHENNEYFYAYCMDASTGANPTTNKWYNIRNLEDAIWSEDNPDGYLTADEAAMIRAIALNGYWGTNGKNEDGSVKYELDEDGNETDIIRRGSLESLKEMLRSTYSATDTIKVYHPNVAGAVKDENGDDLLFNIYELIDGLTEAEALAVTQAAIWTFANNEDITYVERKDAYGNPTQVVYNASVVGLLSAAKYHNSTTLKNGSVKYGSWLNDYKPAGNLQSDARIRALYLAMLNLKPIEADSGSDTDVIPNKDVISEVALIIHDKASEEEFMEVNTDDNADNDVYNVDLSFSLAFVPDSNSDDILVYLYNGDELMTDSEGKPLVRRLAGSNSEGEEYSGVEYDAATDSYLLTGLQLGENNEYQFDLRLHGTQHLENGVYIYQAHGGRSESQTLVGLASGYQEFSYNTSLTLSFDVDESRNVVVERVWHEELDPVTYPPNPPTPIDDDPDPKPPVPDDVPPDLELSDPVGTGDSSNLWLAIIMMSLFTLAAINIPARKREKEFF